MKNQIKILLGLLFIFFAFVNKADAYVAPIGIPAPDFGIEQVHTIYSGQVYSSGGFVYRDAGNGPYSHYIDNNADNCTDINNIYGTEAIPRCSVPISIAAGSVVELHGGPYGALDLTGGIYGTAQKPIFIRGFNQYNKIVFTGKLVSHNSTVKIKKASYIILENIICDGSGLGGSVGSNAFSIKSPVDHVVIRFSEMRNYPMPDFCPDLNRACWYNSVNDSSTESATYDSNPSARSSYIVWYSNHIYDNSVYPILYETGRHGIMVESGSENVWILNNKIERSGDDGVQIFHYAGGGHGPSPRNVYIGNNEVSDMGENAFDIKQSYDVIISQNKTWGFSQTNQLGAGSDGAAIVLNNDDPSDRLWVIGNEIFNSNIGIRSQAKGNNYIIGNIFHNIVRYPGATIPSSTGNSSGCAIVVSGYASMTIDHNTIDAVDCGVSVIKGVIPAVVDNNIISNLNETTSYAIIYNTSPLLFVNNNLLFNAGLGFKKASSTNGLVGLNPAYANRANYNYNLLPDSSAINRANELSAYANFFNLYGISIAKDSLGTNRPQESIWDIGAFEYSGQMSLEDILPPSAPMGVSVL